jgi:CheY-like chemotaxis protein
VAKRVLVLEDDPGMLGLVSDVLMTSGYEVIADAHPESALQRLKSEAVDLLVCDYNLPDMQGDTFFHILGYELADSAEGAGVPGMPPVIVMTGHADDERVQKWLGHSNVVGIIQKPFEIAEFLAIVKKSLKP